MELFRIKYASRFAANLDRTEIESLVRKSASNNARLGITGVLAAVGGVFLQVLEGPEPQVRALLRRIECDPRHRDFLTLRTHTSSSPPLFPSWSMRLLELEPSDDVRAIDALLRRGGITAHEQDALEGRIWTALMAAAQAAGPRATDERHGHVPESIAVPRPSHAPRGQ